MTTHQNNPEEKFTFCKNCEKNIPSNKWILHENFCIQHVKKCEICGEIINKEEEEEHIEDFHSKRKCEICCDEFQGEEYFKHKQTCLNKVPCQYCHKEFNPKELNTHKNICDLNVYYCNYCLSDISVKDKKDHEYFCGSKTEKCSICNKYVRLKEMDYHISLDCHPEEVPISKQIDFNNIPIKKKTSTKPGIIANLNQMGILHKNENNEKAERIEKTEKPKEIKPNNQYNPNINLGNDINTNNLNNNKSLITQNFPNKNMPLKNSLYENIPNNENLQNKNHVKKPIDINVPIVKSNVHIKANERIISKADQLTKKDEKRETNSIIKAQITRKDISRPPTAKNEKKSNLQNLKEVEQNLSSLNNLQKKFVNINDVEIKGKNPKSKNIEPTKNPNGMNLNYRIFEENKEYSKEEPKFNVFIEKKNDKYNFNEDEFDEFNKNAKLNHNYENIYPSSNIQPSNNKKPQILETKNNKNNMNLSNKNDNNLDKDYKKKINEVIKSGNLPKTNNGHVYISPSPITNSNKKENRDNLAKETNTKSTKINNNGLSTNNNERVVKNIPYNKHFDINSCEIYDQDKNKIIDPKKNNQISYKNINSIAGKEVSNSKQNIDKKNEKIKHFSNLNLQQGNKGKENSIDINSNIKSNSNKQPKKYHEKTSKNFNYEDFQNDFVYDEGFETHEIFGKINKKQKDDFSEKNYVEDDIIKQVLEASKKDR